MPAYILPSLIRCGLGILEGELITGVVRRVCHSLHILSGYIFTKNKTRWVVSQRVFGDDM